MSDVFTGIGCFKGTFSLQVIDNVKGYKVLPMYVTYALQEPFKKELEGLQHHHIVATVGVDEMAKLYNSFIIGPGSHGT